MLLSDVVSGALVTGKLNLGVLNICVAFGWPLFIWVFVILTTSAPAQYTQSPAVLINLCGCYKCSCCPSPNFALSLLSAF